MFRGLISIQFVADQNNNWDLVHIYVVSYMCLHQSRQVRIVLCTHSPHLVCPHWFPFHNPLSFPCTAHLKTYRHTQILHIEYYSSVTVSRSSCDLLHHTSSFLCVRRFNLVHEVVGVPLGDFLGEDLLVVWEILCKGNTRETINRRARDNRGLKNVSLH